MFAQLWKEYALSDSRYLTGDVVVLCAETLTVLLWGPLSYLTVVAILKSSPWRHPLQTIVSMAHFVGDLLYMSTSLVDLYASNNLYSRPEPYYLWFYFFSLNAIWLVIPCSAYTPFNPFEVLMHTSPCVSEQFYYCGSVYCMGRDQENSRPAWEFKLSRKWPRQVRISLKLTVNIQVFAVIRSRLAGIPGRQPPQQLNHINVAPEEYVESQCPVCIMVSTLKKRNIVERAASSIPLLRSKVVVA